jgi:hypothetical protein
MLERVRFLATGNAERKDTATGEITKTRESWEVRWALGGVHSHKWWWVNRYGQMDCGCVRNPLTRRMVLYSGDCTARGIRQIRERRRHGELG